MCCVRLLSWSGIGLSDTRIGKYVINIGSLRVSYFGEGLKKKEHHYLANWSRLWGNPAVIFLLISWKIRDQLSFGLVN